LFQFTFLPTEFGDVWLALGLWRLLGLDKLLSNKMLAGREEIFWHKVTECKAKPMARHWYDEKMRLLRWAVCID